MVKKIVDDIHKEVSIKELVKRGFYSGIGWAVGATLGFAIISTILIFLLKQAGGLPLVGSFIASIVQATIEQLVQRTPVFPS